MRVFLISTAISILSVAIHAQAAEEFVCPEMPSAVTQVNRDVRVDVEAHAGSLGRVSAGQIAAKTDIAAKNLFEKYPHVDRLLTTQMMAATYCSLLKSSSLTAAERLRRWEAFFSKVISLQLGQSPQREALDASQPANAVTMSTRPESNDKASSLLPPMRRAMSKEDQVLEQHQPSLSFVVGQDSLASESVVYLQGLARKLRGLRGIAVKLIPFASREMRANPLSAEALELALKRQLRVRDVLTKAGLPSPQIVFVRNQAYGNTTDEVFDDAGRPIELGLSVELAKRDA